MRQVQKHIPGSMGSARTTFERDHTRKVNTFGFALMACHLPVLCGVAALLGNSVLLSMGVALLLLAGPAVVLLRDRASEFGAIVLAITATGLPSRRIFCR